MLCLLRKHGAHTHQNARGMTPVQSLFPCPRSGPSVFSVLCRERRRVGGPFPSLFPLSARASTSFLPSLVALYHSYNSRTFRPSFESADCGVDLPQPTGCRLNRGGV